jgi:predicted nucleic acid-binding protein
MDLLIATTCLCREAPLLTRNARRLERVPGLRLLAY